MCSISYVVVGGGIAGVSCAEQLSLLAPEADVTLVSASRLIKAVTHFKKVSHTLEEFEVREKQTSYLTETHPNVRVVHLPVTGISSQAHTVQLSDGSVLVYDKLCICTGASPKLITESSPFVVGIRDVDSVENLQRRLRGVKRLLVVGNGGIAMELVYEVTGCEVVWAIKDRSIGHVFLDAGAATFFYPHLNDPLLPSHENTAAATGLKYRPSTATTSRSHDPKGPSSSGTCTCDPQCCQCDKDGCSGVKVVGDSLVASSGGGVGPSWSAGVRMQGVAEQGEKFRHVQVEYNCEVADILTPEQYRYDDEQRTLTVMSKSSSGTVAGSGVCHSSTGASVASTENRSGVAVSDVCASSDRDAGRPTASGNTPAVDHGKWPVYVRLTSGKVFGCDLVVSATGVVPNVKPFMRERFELDKEDGGIKVDREMRTSVPDVYAAGDVCSVHWDPHSRLWFQMRLWTQARQMGAYAAQCMVSHTAHQSVSLDFCFELFAHVTHFFGHKVVLLGRFNAQGLSGHEILLRCTKGKEYVKVILQDGKMVGAVLIGDTDLEETFENLILNQMDLSRFGESLLDPDIDIEDYFD